MNPAPSAPDQLTLESLLARMDSMVQRVAGLEQALQEKDHIIAQQQAQIQERDLKIAKLTHELTQLKKMVFGARSERFVPTLPPQQLGLFAAAPAAVPPLVEQTPIPEKALLKTCTTRAGSLCRPTCRASG